MCIRDSPDVKLEGGDDALAKPFIARVDGRNVPDKGSKIYVYPNPNHMHVFNLSLIHISEPTRPY